MPAGWSTTTLAPEMWHRVAINDTGSVMLAGSIDGAGGSLRLSTNGGSTWTAQPIGQGNGAVGWIDMKASADGTRLAAVQFLGSMFISSNGGTSWTEVPGAGFAGQAYESVFMSSTGTRICAAIMDGAVYCSNNGGTSFTAATSGGAQLTGKFRALAGSTDGTTLYAGAGDGRMYKSTNGGATFAPLAVTVNGAAVNSGWYRMAASADGNTVVAAGNNQYAGPSTGIYISHDGGANWTLAYGEGLDFTSLSMSTTGNVILASASDSNGGRILMSTDGGATFSQVSNPPGGETNWRSVAINPSATRAIAATGTFLGVTGNVYRFSGSLGTP